MIEIINEYFINPIIYGTGYNILNTLVFSLILITSLFFVMKLLRKMKVKLNDVLWWKLFPIVLLGGILRALQDQSLFIFLEDLQFIFVTPMIYFLIFSIAIVFLYLDKKIKKNRMVYANYFMVAFFIMFAFFLGREWTAFFIAIILTWISFGIIYFVLKYLKLNILNKVNSTVVLAHTLDACTSVTAISILGGFTEQHIVPKFIFTFLPFYYFIPIKIGLALFAVYLIDKEVKDEWNWLLMLTIFILGMGQVIRNLLTILMV